MLKKDKFDLASRFVVEYTRVYTCKMYLVYIELKVRTTTDEVWFWLNILNFQRRYEYAYKIISNG